MYQTYHLMIGEAYMASEWRSKDLSLFFRKVATSDNYNKYIYSTIKTNFVQSVNILSRLIINELKTYFMDMVLNNQSVELSKRVGKKHYDIPDVLYNYMLDSHRQYTCGYWKTDTTSLEDAQKNKINLLKIYIISRFIIITR